MTQRKNIQQFSVGDSVPFILLMFFLTFGKRAKGVRVCGPFPCCPSFRSHWRLWETFTAHWSTKIQLTGFHQQLLCSRKVSNREPCALLYSLFFPHTMDWHETRTSTKGSPPVRSSSEFFVLCSIEELVNWVSLCGSGELVDQRVSVALITSFPISLTQRNNCGFESASSWASFLV